ncbi:conserved hypothetical protein [Vibrio jasicida]|uniref:Uncharacterized protein n=1 Tax=Vibrio jasicida TaxID=766224 RepID=A0AAU9QZ51_9VIBR|nr:conserved hypothetical protein [Vibrio jasicida]CAH1603512.1 conserved hypothetical protein [Vibrio jasicida]
MCANNEQTTRTSSRHKWSSETAKQAQEKSVQSRLESNALKAKLRQEALQLIKQKSMAELVDELKINVNIGNEVKQDIYAYLLKALIDVEIVETAKHRFKTEQMFTKHELDELLKEQPTKQDISLTGERMSIQQAMKSGVIDDSRISIDDLNFLRTFVQ